MAKRKAAPGVPAAVRDYLAAAGRKGGAARWAGIDAASRRAFAQRIGRLGGRPRKIRAPKATNVKRTSTETHDDTSE